MTLQRRAHAAQAGFTLVEVLVVMVIIAVGAGLVTLGFDRLREDRLSRQASELSSWLQGLSDDAVLDGAVYGAWLDGAGQHLDTGYFHRGRWWPLAEEDRSLALVGGVDILLATGDGWHTLAPAEPPGRDGEIAPQLVFEPHGAVVPDQLRLREEDREVTLARDQDGLFAWQSRR